MVLKMRRLNPADLCFWKLHYQRARWRERRKQLAAPLPPASINHDDSSLGSFTFWHALICLNSVCDSMLSRSQKSKMRPNNMDVSIPMSSESPWLWFAAHQPPYGRQGPIYKTES